MSVAAEAITQLLADQTPVFPEGLALPERVAGSSPDGIEDTATWVKEQWGWLALTWWCRFRLSRGQQEQLRRQHYDLDELGNDFLCYLVSDQGVNGATVRAPASYILASAHPPAVLSDWFGRFLTSDSGPFERSVCWKLKRRFDDILEADQRFTLVGDAWRLSTQSPSTSSHSGGTKGRDVREHLASAVGPIQPLLYKEKVSPPGGKGRSVAASREDPLIRKEDGIRVALTAIRYNGPMTSWELALACRVLLPESLWCEFAREADGEGVERRPAHGPHDEDDRGTALSEAPRDETTVGEQLLSATQVEALAREAWKGLSAKHRIVAAARLFQNPPWTLQEIQNWTTSRLGRSLHMRLQRVHDLAGKDDSKIRAAVRAAIPRCLVEGGGRSDCEAFLVAMEAEARKTLATPPSDWI